MYVSEECKLIYSSYDRRTAPVQLQHVIYDVFFTVNLKINSIILFKEQSSSQVTEYTGYRSSKKLKNKNKKKKVVGVT